MEKYFGQFSKKIDALITHKVVVIVMSSFFTVCRSMLLSFF